VREGQQREPGRRGTALRAGLCPLAYARATCSRSPHHAASSAAAGRSARPADQWADIDATPVLAMLHVLADTLAGRNVWRLYCARNRAEEPFAAESRRCWHGWPAATGPHRLQPPGPDDAEGRDYQTEGRLSASVAAALNSAARCPGLYLRTGRVRGRRADRLAGMGIYRVRAETIAEGGEGLDDIAQQGTRGQGPCEGFVTGTTGPREA
jgi:hypothetical protein